MQTTTISYGGVSSKGRTYKYLGEDMNSELENKNNKDENPYLLMGFWEFAIMSTLMVVFFPWSLLFCVIFFGLTETKYIVRALIHDAFQTFLAILSIVMILVVLIGGLILIFGN